MAPAIAICSSIEAEKIGIQTRQFYTSPPQLIKKSGAREMRFPFSLGINSSAWIEREYASGDGVVFETSKLAEGEGIQGGSIDGWARAPLGKPTVKKGSASHSASFLTIEGGCYAHIQSAERAHLNSADMAAKIAPIEQKEKKRESAVLLSKAAD